MSKRDDNPPTLRCAIYTRKSTEDEKGVKKGVRLT